MSRLIFLSLFFFLLLACSAPVVIEPVWPEVARETKPWTRWWWHGNAVTKEGITAELEAYQAAGLGGVEITPIYGVFGYEEQFVDFLSPQWMELLLHTLREAERLNMGVDMATGTGWPFGGRWVNDEDACKNFEYKVYTMEGGKSLPEKIVFVQPPYLRAIGNLIADEKGGVRVDPKSIDIKNLKQPIAANTNLQTLAIDQIKFERPLPLRALRAYSQAGEVVELMDKVTVDGKLNWIAPAGSWKVYAVFEGMHGKMVERAGPGGEGNVIDHFSTQSLHNYLTHFDQAMANHDIKNLRAFFNDSYEVDDARGAADWTPALFDEFKKQQGYDLRDHIPAWLGEDANQEMNERILSDYRETISELVLNNFTQPWREWAHGKQAIVRNQAHGSPSNILDLYAAVDIPEIEGTEPLRIKMASSAANVTGKKLVSSESATWQDEHFESNLGDIKGAVDLFLLNGVNHIFYHGTCYSPPNEPWPGWLFYAAVHLNPRNPMWNDFDALNQYVTRCQSLLQESKAHHDVLLYFPVYDRFVVRGPKMIEHFDGLGKQFSGTSFEKCAEYLYQKGYTFDFISDKQIQHTSTLQGELVTEGAAHYKTILIPKIKYMPVTTLQKLVKLAEDGATIIFIDALPESFSGFQDYENQQKVFGELKDTIQQGKFGNGKVLVENDLQHMFDETTVKREMFIDAGLQFSRRKTDGGNVQYFLSNTTGKVYQGWVTLQQAAKGVVLQNPMTGVIGKASVKHNEGTVDVLLSLQPGETVFVILYDSEIAAPAYPIYKEAGSSIVFHDWNIDFTAGGPALPASIKTNTLTSWTNVEGAGYNTFSGTATYICTFNQPENTASVYLLDLGEVHETARVVLNGKELATLIGPTYQIEIPQTLLMPQNTLTIRVSNLMANRIIDLEQRNVLWKKFYNVNMAARKPENRALGIFSAKQWTPRLSGLLGPVRLIPLTAEE